jgi:hypothetical protein
MRRAPPSLLLLALHAACGTTSEPSPSAAASVPAAPVAPPRSAPDEVSAAPPVAVPDADPVDALVQQLRLLEFDPAPAGTTNDKHYLVSNERRLDLYRPDIDGLGGVALGVGTDQNYIMAAWSRPQLLVIVDFDLQVVDLHAVHGAFFRAAPDIEALRRLWSAEGVETARAILRQLPAGPPRARQIALYESSRAEVDKRLRVLTRRYEELDIRSYLDTPAEYDFVRDLFVRDRVVAIRGDFTEPGVVRRVGEVLSAHAQTVRVLYLSNIEQYFRYREPFKRNMLQLPFDGSTLVLRTLPGRPAGFQYMLQRGADFHTWMRASKVWSVYRMRGFIKGEPLAASERWFIETLPSDRDG